MHLDADRWVIRHSLKSQLPRYFGTPIRDLSHGRKVPACNCAQAAEK